MTLIKSISGIRGTIGGMEGDAFTPNDIVKFVAPFGYWLKETGHIRRKIVIGRDARLSGEIVSKIVSGTLQSMGLDVIDLGSNEASLILRICDIAHRCENYGPT